MTPETKASLISDFKSRKFASAAALAKAHGLSRSAVYRVLKAENLEGQANQTVQAANQTVQAANQSVQANQTVDKVPDDFYFRTDKFADDLGLPTDSSRLRHNVEDKSPEEQKEDEVALEAAIDVIAGGSMNANDIIPEDLMNKIYGVEQPTTTKAKPRGARHEMRFENVSGIDFDNHQPEQKDDVIQRIIFNVENFASHLTTITGPSTTAFIASLGTRGVAELSSLLKTIERTRSVNNVAAGFKQVFYMFGQATEVGSKVIGLKTAGFTDSLKQQDAEVTMCLKEIAINEWERLKSFDSPQLRLGMLFTMTLLQTDAKNRMGEQLQKVVAAPVSEGVYANANYKDL